MILIFMKSVFKYEFLSTKLRFFNIKTQFLSSKGVGIQKIAIHSQLIGLKTALKISDIMKKSDDQD